MPEDPKATKESKPVAQVKTPATVSENLPKYKVIRHLNHDSQDYLPGDTVTLDDDAAEHLIAAGVIGINEE